MEVKLRLNISTKLYAGFGAAVVILLLISAVSFNGVQGLVSNSADVTHTHEVLAEKAGGTLIVCQAQAVVDTLVQAGERTPRTFPDTAIPV